MKNLSVIDWVAFVLLVVGGLNWGLVGLFEYNLVTAIVGAYPMLYNSIFILVGLSALYVAAILAKLEKK